MAKAIVIKLIKVYRFFSRMFPRNCRFIPTCSEYAIQAVQKHGAAKGLVKATGRVLRCNPYNAGGFDPV